MAQKRHNGAMTRLQSGQVFTDQLRAAMSRTVTDEKLQTIINKQIELAEQGDRKAAEFVLKLCGFGQTPAKLVQNNYYYGENGKTKAKTPLGNRMAQYIRKHGPAKPASLATELDAELEEIEHELKSRPDRFRRGREGIEVTR